MKSLIQLRKLNGYTLEILRVKTDLTQGGLSRIETGKQVPDRGTRIVLEDFFKEKINWLKVKNLRVSPKYPTNWIDVELDFRRYYRTVCGLPQDERSDFICSCIVHLKKLERSKSFISEEE